DRPAAFGARRTMIDPRTLAMLIEQAQARRDEAAGRSASARAEHAAAAATLRTLTDYREQALAASPLQEGARLDRTRLTTGELFARRLSTAIDAQQRQVDAR